MGVLISKPGITSASTLSIPKDWSPSWFRNLIENQLKGADVRNATGSGGISVSGNIASPYAMIGFKAPVVIPGPVTINGSLTITGDPLTFHSQFNSDNGTLKRIMDDANDGWLRINQTGNFGNGVYTPGNLRVDGAIFAGASANFQPITVTALPHGSMITAGGGVGGYVGLAAYDGGIYPTLMGAGTNGGLYANGPGIWLTLYQGGNVLVGAPFLPETDNAWSCGASGNRWTVVYAVTGTINTSDARLKTDIAPSPLGLDFINALKPVSYKWITGGSASVQGIPDAAKRPPPVSVPGIRTHFGLLAQDVKAALDALAPGQDFAGWTLADKNDPTSTQGLRYSQFIAPLIKSIQELHAQVTAQQAEIASLQQQVSKLI